MAEEGLLERLVITEEKDMTESVVDKGAASSSAVILQSCSGESILKEEHNEAGNNGKKTASQMCLEQQIREKQQTNKEEDQTGGVVVTKEGTPNNINDGQNRGEIESEGQTHVVMRSYKIPAKPSDKENEKVTQNDPQVDVNRLNSSVKQREGTQNQEDDPTKVFIFLLFYFDFIIGPEITFIVIVSMYLFVMFLTIGLEKNPWWKQQVSFCYRACGST